MAAWKRYFRGSVLFFIWIFIAKTTDSQNSPVIIKPPNNVRVNKFFNNGVELMWDYNFQNDDSENDTIFLLQYKRSNDAIWNVSNIYGNTTSFNITSLQKGSWYQARVKTKRINEPLGSNWTPVFLFMASMSNKILFQNDLATPKNLTASILSPSVVHLRWWSRDSPAAIDNGMYYLVELETRNESTGIFASTRSIQVVSQSFLLQALDLGVTYRFRIRTCYGREASEPTDWISIRMPTEAELFSVANLRVSYSDDEPGFVNLSWSVPDNIRKSINGYVVWYTTNRQTDLWSQSFFQGSEPKASLYYLTPNTTYYVTIEIQLTGGSKSESNVFQFKTPPVNPMRNVDIIYLQNFTSVRIQWSFKSFIDLSRISGYTLMLGKDRESAEEKWKRFYPTGQAYELSELTPGSQYFVKFQLRMRDGANLTIPTIYQFTTLKDSADMNEHSVVLAYQRISPGVIKVRWTFPPKIISKAVTEWLVFYTNEPNRPDMEWMKIMVPGDRNDLVLTGLRAMQYYVKVLPRVHGSTMDTMASEPSVFQINPVGPAQSNVTSELTVANRISDQSPVDNTKPDVETLCFQKCRHEKGKGSNAADLRIPQELQCSPDEECVILDNSTFTGFCLPKIITAVMAGKS